MGVSQHATQSMETVAKAAASAAASLPLASSSSSLPAPCLWYQLYILKDRQLTAKMVERAEKAGYKVGR